EVDREADVLLRRELGLVDAQAQALGVLVDAFRLERFPVQVEDEVERRVGIGPAELVLQVLERQAQRQRRIALLLERGRVTLTIAQAAESIQQRLEIASVTGAGRLLLGGFRLVLEDL